MYFLLFIINRRRPTKLAAAIFISQYSIFFRKIFVYLLFKFWQVKGQHFLYNAKLYLEIFMCDIVAHADNHLPLCGGMCLAEFGG